MNKYALIMGRGLIYMLYEKTMLAGKLFCAYQEERRRVRGMLCHGISMAGHAVLRAFYGREYLKVKTKRSAYEYRILLFYDCFM